jgi:Kef-type K+ transport system membrane component KefB
MVHNLKHPLAILLAQIITIIIVARFLGGCFAKSGNRRSLAKLLPESCWSFTGRHVFSRIFTSAFPAESLGNLQFLSQIGLILFMFVIGMELDLKVLQNKAKEAVVISHASIVIPFALGVGLAYFIYYRFAPESIEFFRLAFSWESP